MTDDALLDLARRAREHAYAPYSRFSVGAALLCEDGSVFHGCNVENASYGAGICAERTALVKAVSEGQRRFARIAIMGSGGEPCWPCGICRQMLAEFSPEMTVLAANREGQVTTLPLSALLPKRFGPDHLDATT